MEQRGEFVLPQIRASLKIEIPLPISNRYDPSMIPSGIMSYKKLKGTPLQPDRLSSDNLPAIAKQLGNLLANCIKYPSIHYLQVVRKK